MADHQGDAEIMRALLCGVATAAVAKAFNEADYLTQPTRIEDVDTFTGRILFRLASGMLVTVRVEVTDA